MWDDYYDEDYGWDDSSTTTDDGYGGGDTGTTGDTGTDSDVDGSSGDGGTDPIYYDDGSVMYPDSGEIYDSSGELIGSDSGFGDGSWYNLDGALFNADNQWVPDIFFVQDSTTGQWYDTLTGTYYDDDGKVSELQPRDPPDTAVDTGGNTVTDLPTNVPGGDGSNTGGFLDKLGNALKGLFGGGGGAGSSSGNSQANQAAQQRQQQAQNALQKAQQSGTATPAMITALQKQLAAAQSVLAATSGGMTKTILVAGLVGLGVYAVTRRRD